MNDNTDLYGWYMDRLTGAGVMLVLGVLFFVAGFATMREHLIVETAGQWFYIDVVRFDVMLAKNLVAVIGAAMAIHGADMFRNAMREYHQMKRQRVVSQAFVFAGLLGTVATVLLQAKEAE